MPAILGLRDTTSFDSFENWRRMILYLFPNGKAPLTALLSLTDPEETNHPTIHWYEKPLPTQRTTIVGAYTDVATTFVLANVVMRVGHLILNELTDEIMEVTGMDSTGLNPTVVRGKWGPAVASSGASDPIIVIGSVNAEGGFIPQAISEDPTEYNNKTQIWRTPIELTRTAMGSTVKWDRSGPYKEQCREKLSLHSIEMEKSFIFGKKAQWNDAATGKTKRTVGGILEFIPAGYKVTPASSAGAVTRAEFTSWLELLFRYCSNQANEKLALCGSGFLSAINDMALMIGQMNTMPGDKAFGMSLAKWETPFGTLFLKTHPLFTQHPVWRYNALCLDVHNLNYRPMIGGDTQRLTNRQANDQDARIDEFLTEASLEPHHFGTGETTSAAENGTHLYITNVQSWSGT